MTFVKRLITVQFDLATGVFAGGGNKATVDGLRISCKIKPAGGVTMGTAEIAIYGLPLSVMNQLTTVGKSWGVVQNDQITILAGDEQSGMQLVFAGTMRIVWVDGQSQPDVALRISAFDGGQQAVQKTESTSVKGSGDVATIMSQLASQGGLQFEGNGVSVKLANPYLWGSVRSQMLQLATAAGVEFTIEKNVCAIWKPGTARQGGAIMVSPQTGLVAYPVCVSNSIMLKMLFNPALKYGAKITVQSDITPACGDWTINAADYDLESQVPNGQWFATIQATTLQVGPA